jgi:hypothetical protein
MSYEISRLVASRPRVFSAFARYFLPGADAISRRLAPYGRMLWVDIMRKIVRLQPAGGFELDLQFFAIIART